MSYNQCKGYLTDFFILIVKGYLIITVKNCNKVNFYTTSSLRIFRYDPTNNRSR